MKKDIHPENYRMVVFKDLSTGDTFLSRSTAPAKETIVHEDGNEYPLVKLEISSKSHPFFTGKMNFIDTAGRIDKFKNKYARHLKKDAKAAPAPEATEAPEAESTEENAG